MNKYKVTLVNPTVLKESAENGAAGDADEYCKIVEVDVPAYLIGVGVSDFLDSHLRSHGFIKEGWEVKESERIN